MADFTCNLQQTAYANAMSIAATRTFTGESQITLSPVIPDGTTNQLVLIAIDVSLLKFLAIKSDKAITIKTNSSGSPDDTLSILAGVPYIWGDGGYDTCLLTTDVASMYITNATADDANVQIIALVDLP